MTSGRRIGRYQVVEMVGAGAFATVYRALDERLDDTVAVKVLAENHSFTPEVRERFLREGRVLRRIESPHVVTVHDLGETEDRQPFLVLDFADRGTLRQRAGGRRRQGWHASTADVLAVARPLAQALTAVHRVDVVHRDLNPGNVLLTTRGGHLVEAPEQAGDGGAGGLLGHDERLVLADLGLCKDLALNSGHTSAGGTQGFQPPELRRGPAIIDGRADLWSLSALVVWLVTGEPPEGQDVEAAITAAGHPAALAEALNRSLAESPDDRHPDAAMWWQEVAAALSASAAPGAGVAAMSAGESVAAAPTQIGLDMVRPEWVPPDGPEPVSAPLSESASQQPDMAGAVSAGPGPTRPLHGPGQAGPWPPYGQAQGQGHPAPGLYDSAHAGHVGPTTVGAAGQAQTAVPEAHGYAHGHGHGGNIGHWSGSAWPPASASLPARDRSWGWLLRHSLWLLPTLLLGFLTWVGFLYVGLRVNDRVWKMAAVGYAVGAAALLVLIMLSPVDADGNAVEGAWQETSAILLMVALWVGGFVHALFANVRWLRWRASEGP